MPIRIFIDQGHNPQGVNAGAEGFGLREQDVNYAVEGVSVPFHPGAEKYFKEAGALS